MCATYATMTGTTISVGDHPHEQLRGETLALID